MDEGLAKKYTGKCPQCGEEGGMIPNVELRAAGNVTVMECYACEWEFAKDQSVKISGNLVRLAALAMNHHEGYSSLGDFVRDSVRRHSEGIIYRATAEAGTELMAAIIENPESLEQFLAGLEEDEE